MSRTCVGLGMNQDGSARATPPTHGSAWCRMPVVTSTNTELRTSSEWSAMRPPQETGASSLATCAGAFLAVDGQLCAGPASPSTWLSSLPMTWSNPKQGGPHWRLRPKPIH